jgi:membrane protein implicated in regulation of membrane protease activity
MNYAIIFAIILLIAAWYAWRYYKLRRNLDDYASRLRGQDVSTDI